MQQIKVFLLAHIAHFKKNLIWASIVLVFFIYHPSISYRLSTLCHWILLRVAGKSQGMRFIFFFFLNN